MKAHIAKRRFENIQKGHNKFWEITGLERGFSVKYGKIGTDGVVSNKYFTTELGASEEYYKIIQSKLNKGYKEIMKKEVKTDKPVKAKKFKMRLPPTQLTKKEKKFAVGLNKTGTGLDSALKMLLDAIKNSKGYGFIDLDWVLANLDKVSIEQESSYYYSRSRKMQMSIKVPESDADFDTRMAKYQVEIDEYNSWRKDNAEDVKKWENAQNAKKQERINKKQEALARRMAEIKQKMNKLQTAV